MRDIIATIITVLKCDEDHAMEVEDFMAEWYDLDYSRITKNQLTRAIKEADIDLVEVK